MNNTYIIPKGSIVEVFEDIEKFMERIKLFQEFQPDYLYELTVKKQEKKDLKWELCAKIWKDEQVNNKVPQEVTNPFGVL